MEQTARAWLGEGKVLTQARDSELEDEKPLASCPAARAREAGDKRRVGKKTRMHSALGEAAVARRFVQGWTSTLAPSGRPLHDAFPILLSSSLQLRGAAPSVLHHSEGVAAWGSGSASPPPARTSVPAGASWDLSIYPCLEPFSLGEAHKTGLSSTNSGCQSLNAAQTDSH